ncbi:MAG: signal peptidase II [Deltaproteobacteria bacterium]|jgi:signal peptidase II|nr:signal peptidase II [Deltaproteobacteria bacterium]
MKHFRLLIAVSMIILLFDQATKLYIDAHFRLHETLPVVKGLFNLTYVRNKGAAFGILSDSVIRIPFFITVSLIAMLAILWYFNRLRQDQKLAAWGLSLVFAGAFGNLIDRIRLGEVIDFLDIYWRSYHWPAFNVADSAISTGVFLLILDMWREERKKVRPDHSSLKAN